MKASDFWRAVIAGFFAAYLMGVVSGWERTLGGVPSPQPLGLLATSPTIPFDFYINGIVLALIYARWIHGRFNWHPLILQTSIACCWFLSPWVFLFPCSPQRLAFSL